MQHTKKSTLWSLGLAAAASLASFHGASAADGIKAAYVETVIPSKSYTGQATVSVFGNSATFGPSQAGVLGIGSIVLTNTDLQTQPVIVGIPGLGGSPCGTSTFTSYFTTFYFYVPAQSTLVVPFPIPYVINPAGGQACIAIEAAGFVYGGATVSVLVTGELN